MFEKCEGIVIRTIDYGETNKIVTIFTREWGKVAAMARGAKKPSSRLSSVTQIFTYGIFLIQKSRGVGSLHQGELLSTMRHIREDIFLTAYASYIVELTDKATEERRPNPYLFELLLQTLTYMNEGLDAEVLTYIYEMKLLPAFGLYPKLDGCAICGEKEGTFAFSIAQGGFLCHRCFEHDPHRIPMTPSVLKLLRLFYYVDLSRIGQIAVKSETKQQIKTIISAYYDEYSGLSLKTKRFLQQLRTLDGKSGQI